MENDRLLTSTARIAVFHPFKVPCSPSVTNKACSSTKDTASCSRPLSDARLKAVFVADARWRWRERCKRMEKVKSDGDNDAVGCNAAATSRQQCHGSTSRFKDAHASSAVSTEMALASRPSSPPIRPSSAPLALFFPLFPPDSADTATTPGLASSIEAYWARLKRSNREG